MEPEAFFVLTELGIGLAGFSAIVVAIGQRGGQVERMSRFRLLTLLSTALLAAFGALVPQLLAGLGFAGGSLWRGASALLGVLVVALVVDSEVRRHRLGANERATIVPLLYLAMIIVMAAIALWLAANVLSAAPSPGPVFGSLVLLLACSAIVFVRFLVARANGRSGA